MAKVLKIECKTYGSTKVVLRAEWKLVKIATCKLTWFPLQQTVHVWLKTYPVNQHQLRGVARFQKFEGCFQDLVNQYLSSFRDVMWELILVLQGKLSANMLPYRFNKVNSHVEALVHCLLTQITKSVDMTK